MICRSSKPTFFASRAFLAAISFPTFKLELAADPEVTTVLATVEGVPALGEGNPAPGEGVPASGTGVPVPSEGVPAPR